MSSKEKYIAASADGAAAGSNGVEVPYQSVVGLDSATRTGVEQALNTNGGGGVCTATDDGTHTNSPSPSYDEENPASPAIDVESDPHTESNDDHCASHVDLDKLRLPIALKPFLKRISALPSADVSDEEIVNIMFIIRLADSMHQSAYATFLTASFVDELRTKLECPDLALEIELNALRWSYAQGTVSTVNSIAVDYDGAAMQTLSKIALGVLDGTFDVEEGFKLIDDAENGDQYHGLEKRYRQFPTRIFIIPLLAATGATCYFDGTWVDFGFSIITGTVAGLVYWMCTKKRQLVGVSDMLVSGSVAMVSTAAITIMPNATCFQSQVLGTLFWFFYGISFTMSLYEITQGLILTGLTRLAMVILNSFVLAFGAITGVWIAAYGGPNRFENITKSCTNLDYEINRKWLALLFPLVAIGALMQLRVSMKYWGICLAIEFLAQGSQWALENLVDAPDFIYNTVPAFLATIGAHFIIECSAFSSCFNLNLTVPKTSYLLKQFEKGPTLIKVDPPSLPTPKNVEDIGRKLVSKIHFKDYGWADSALNLNGYIRNERNQYQRSDLWFCLIPAIYLLVPGSSVFKVAFVDILNSFESNITGSTQALASAVLVTGMSQVIGVRLGLAVLSMFSELRFRKLARTKVAPPEMTKNHYA